MFPNTIPQKLREALSRIPENTAGEITRVPIEELESVLADVVALADLETCDDTSATGSARS